MVLDAAVTAEPGDLSDIRACRSTRTLGLVDVELVPFGIGHRDCVVVQAFLEVRLQSGGPEGFEPRGLGLDELAPGLEGFAPSPACVHVDVDAVLDRLLLRDDLEPDARALTVRVLDAV